MRWRLALLILVTASLVAVLFLPIATVDIRVELPPTMHDVSATQVGDVVSMVVNVIGAILLIAILGFASWVGTRIIRRHRR